MKIGLKKYKYLIVVLCIAILLIAILLYFRSRIIKQQNIALNSLEQITYSCERKNETLKEFKDLLVENNDTESEKYSRITEILDRNLLTLKEGDSKKINQVVNNLRDVNAELNAVYISSYSKNKLEDVKTKILGCDNRLAIQIIEYNQDAEYFNEYKGHGINKVVSKLFGISNLKLIGDENANGNDSDAEVVKDVSVESQAAESFLSSEIKSESEGVISLNYFAKTNGQKQQFLGMELYTIEFTAKIEFERDGYKCIESKGLVWDSFFISVDSSNACNYSYKKGYYKVYSYKFRKGQVITLTGEIVLELTDNGWRGTSYELLTYSFKGEDVAPAEEIKYRIEIR